MGDLQDPEKEGPVLKVCCGEACLSVTVVGSLSVLASFRQVLTCFIHIIL